MAHPDFFVARVAAGKRVLEVGCGYGAVAYSMRTFEEDMQEARFSVECLPINWGEIWSEVRSCRA